MTRKITTPAIHQPVQKEDGSMEWIWYMFMQRISDGLRALEEGEIIAHQAAPSNRHKDFILDVSGTEYEAPSDGCFSISVTGVDNTSWIEMQNMSNNVRTNSLHIGTLDASIFISVSKGDKVKITFNNIAAVIDFRFVYSNGSK